VLLTGNVLQDGLKNIPCPFFGNMTPQDMDSNGFMERAQTNSAVLELDEGGTGQNGNGTRRAFNR